MLRRLLPVLAVVALAVTACSSSSSSSSSSTSSSGSKATASSGAASSGGAASGPKVAAAPSAGCSGAKAPTPGRTQLTIHSGAYDRTYVLYVPQSAVTARGPRPLVLNFHGLTSPIEGQELISDFHKTSDKEGAIEVLPLGRGDGTTTAWNVAKYAGWPDDLQLIKDLLDKTEGSLCIDTNRVYSMGMSNGAQMTSFLACNLSDRIAAFATVAGLYDPGAADCHPARPVPIIAFHGTADPFLPFTGGAGSGLGTLQLKQSTLNGLAGMATHLKPIPEVATVWAQRNGCSTTPMKAPVTAHVSRWTYEGCTDGVEQVLYVIDGGGHSWPGSTGSEAVSKVVGPTNMEINADDLIWAFFTQHPLPASSGAGATASS